MIDIGGVQKFNAPDSSVPNPLQAILQGYSSAINAKYLPQKEQSSITKAIADALNAQAQAKLRGIYAGLPFGGKVYPGAAGQEEGLEAIRQQYGEDSPQYNEALRNYQLGQQATSVRSQYQQRLADTLPLRMTTPAGKSYIEESNVNQGYSPAGTPIGQPVAPGQPAYLPNAQKTEQGEQYELSRYKKNVPASVAQKNLFSANIDKTINYIDPKKLTQFSGIKGALELKKQQALAPFGKQSKDYDDYQTNLTAANLLAHQVRQFYGESIQPIMNERLQKLTNPSFWRSNPDLAIKQYNQFVDILKNETQTYREAGKGTEVYMGSENKSQQQNHSDDDINFTAKKYNMTPDQVRQYLGVR